jgi:PadR family transcriptional regulator, regulatory protein PadR
MLLTILCDTQYTVVMGKTLDAETARVGIVAELRRGLTVVAVLARLGREQYGYTLQKELEAAGLPVDQNTLYPLLRRLETQGLLSSAWKVEAQRPRRYYTRTELGTEVFASLKPELRNQKTLLEVIDHDTV